MTHALLGALSVLALAATQAGATTITFGGADDPSLHGATGSLSIDETGAGTYDVVWTMDFDGYEGSVGDHQYLTNIAFKAFSTITAVTLVEIDWSPETTGTGIMYPSNVNNRGCTDGSSAGMVCIGLSPIVDATQGGTISALFSVEGELMLDEWSYRGKFGRESGWVISESASPAMPMPEPSASLAFATGLLIVGSRIRSASRGRSARTSSR